MPELNRAQVAQLTILLLAVPVQYLLSWASSENARQYELKRVITGFSELQTYFDIKGWLRWCQHLWEDGENDEQPPPEIERQNMDQKGNFASGATPRHPRPPHVQFHVGQVVKHKINGYKGVIVGWDETAVAPKEWLDKMHTGRPDWRTRPNYGVLVDTRDRLTPQLAYIVEENLEIVENVQIIHPLVHNYFEKFDGARYIMRPWLRKVYPQD